MVLPDHVLVSRVLETERGTIIVASSLARGWTFVGHSATARVLLMRGLSVSFAARFGLRICLFVYLLEEVSA